MSKTLKYTSLVLIIGLFFSPNLISQDTRKIRGDSSSWDIANNQMKYFGNAELTYQNLKIQGDQIIAKRDSEADTEVILVSGKPALFKDNNPEQNLATNLTALNIRYQAKSNTINASNNVRIKQVNERNETIDIEGEKLSLIQSQNYRLSVSGRPLTVAIKQTDNNSINANANQLFYDKQSEQFELQGNVILKSDRETLTAERVIYNMKTQILQVPKSDKGQVEIIQTRTNN